MDYAWGAGDWSVLSETRYLYDGMQIVQERDGQNRPVVTYTRGRDLSGTVGGAGGIGGLLARSVHASTAPYAVTSSSLYHADGVGNVTYLADPSNGATQAAYRYDPFGRLVSSSGTLAGANAMRFSSKPTMAANVMQLPDGLSYYGYRFYDPAAARWINRDPLGEAGGINLYQYSYNGPINHVDPDGETPLVTGAIGAGIGAIVGAGVATWNGGSWGDIGYGALRGGVAGGVAGLTLGFGGAALAGTFGGGVFGGAFAGAMAAGAGDLAAQGLDNATGRRCGIDGFGLAGSTVLGGLSGGAFLRPYTAPSQLVTSWAPAGVTLDLNPGRWVMTGGPSIGNYLRTVGPALCRCPYGNSVSGTLPGSSLVYPTGATGNLAGLLGQRIVVP